MSNIKVLKLTTGEEIIGTMFVQDDKPALHVEHPFIIEWDVDPETGYPEVELYPFLYGMKFGCPVFIPTNHIVTSLVEPSDSLSSVYSDRVARLSQYAETAALAAREQSRTDRRRRGKIK